MRVEPRSRGATLIDTLVAIGVFSGLLLVVVLIARSGREAWQKTDVHADSFRAAVTATDHVRRILGQARLETVTGDSVSFYSAVLEKGVAKVGTGGVLVFRETPCTLSRGVRGGLELREGPGGPVRVLAHLGPEGSIRFERVREDLVRVTIRSVVKDPDDRKARESLHEIVSEVYLPNQP